MIYCFEKVFWRSSSLSIPSCARALRANNAVLFIWCWQKFSDKRNMRTFYSNKRSSCTLSTMKTSKQHLVHTLSVTCIVLPQHSPRLVKTFSELLLYQDIMRSYPKTKKTILARHYWSLLQCTEVYVLVPLRAPFVGTTSFICSTDMLIWNRTLHSCLLRL